MTRFHNVFRSVVVLAATAVVALTGGVNATAQERIPTPPPPAIPVEEPVTGDFDLKWGTDDPNARAFNSGACAGTFGTPRVVNGFLEYSLHSTCGGTDWWPHRVTLILQTQKSTPWFPDIFFRDALTDRSLIREEGSPYITVFIAEPCIDTQERTYRVKGKIEAGPHTAQGIDDEEVTVNCRVLNG